MGQVNRISQTGLELIKNFEGLHRRSERLPDGGWIVGYGHTRSAREGVEVTEREAEYLLRYDLQETERLVSNSVLAPLNQNEFDALVSFAWNIGKDAYLASDVLKYVNSGEMLAAAESFGAWRKAEIDGRLIVLDALVRRRAAEKNMFLSHPSGSPAAPSLIIKPKLDTAASVLALADGALSIENRLTEEARESAANASLPYVQQAANSNGETTEEVGDTEPEAEAATDPAEDLIEDEADDAESIDSLIADAVSQDAEAEPVDDEAIEEAAEDAEAEIAEASDADPADDADTEDAVETVETEVVEDAEATDETEEDDSEATETEEPSSAEPSIWDASDDMAFDEVDEDDEEDSESLVDDTLLAAAIAASNLSRRDDEPEDADTEAEVETDTDTAESEDETEETDEAAEGVLLSPAGFRQPAGTFDEPARSVESDEDTAETSESGEDTSEEATDDAVTPEEIEVSEELDEDEDDCVVEEVKSESDDAASDAEVELEEAVIADLDVDEAKSEDAEAEESEAVSEDGSADDVEAETEEAEDLPELTEAEDEADAEADAEAEEDSEAAGEVVGELPELTEAEATEEDIAQADAVEEEVALALVEDAEDSGAEKDGEGGIWQVPAEDALDEDHELTEEEAEARRVTIVDPLVSDHFPGEDNGVDYVEPVEDISGGRPTAAGFWFGVFPFILLALLGGAMCVFGAMDWAGLIQSETPVDESQLYAGPFLTLIGGFGLIFGLYFMFRKLSGAED